MEAFIGSTGDPGTADDVGLKISDTSVIVVVDSAKNYAVDASGSVTVMGLTGLDISGSLRFEKNTTGQTVNQTVTIGTVTRTIQQAPGLTRRSGTLAITAADFVDFSGSFSIADTSDGKGLLIGAADIDVFLEIGRAHV